MKLKSFLKKFARDERGVSALEYAILAAVVAVAVAALGSKISTLYDDLFTRNTLRMNKISIQPEADELSQIYTGTFAITRGTTNEHYELADGRQFDMQGRWTATSIQQPDGSWKLLAVHMGVNFLDNPVINAIERSITWFAAGGAAVGLILGFALGWLVKRPKRAA